VLAVIHGRPVAMRLASKAQLSESKQNPCHALAEAISRIGRAEGALLVERETYFDRHLPMRNLAVLYVSTHLDDFEPAKISQAL
jgi:hypothetical protein